MRLIDAHALWVAISNYCNCRDDALLIIDKVPTIDAELVRHGRWIKLDRDIVVCSECGRHENALLVDSYPYCHCGAKMDGGADNADSGKSV